MIQSFIDGLMNYQFLQYALVTSMLVGLASGVIGLSIILRGMSLMGDAISHAVLPGVAISYMFSFSYTFGATAFGMLAAAVIGFVTQRSRLKNDTAIGIVPSPFFALEIILISYAQSAIDLYHILLGSVLAVRESGLLLTALVSGIVLIFVFFFYKELKIISFDPTMAKAYELNTLPIHYLLMFLLTLVAIVSLQTVGTVLVIAMLITSAATAYLLTNHLLKMIITATGIGMFSVVIGIFFSYSYSWPSGATIVLVCTAFFILTFLFSPTKGISLQKGSRQVKTKKSLFSILAISLLTLVGCGKQTSNQADEVSKEKLPVTATNSILADMAKEVGTDRTDIHSIVPVGTDPHEYEVLPEDVKRASDADVILYSGLNPETGNSWFDNLMETAKKEEGKDYFAVSRSVEPLYLTSGEGHTEADPHAWLDLSNGAKHMQEIACIFSEKDAENATHYKRNVETYVEKLKELDTQAKGSFASIEENKKLLVTNEGAFKYSSRAYDLPAAYIWEINTESQDTPDQMKVIIDQVRAKEVPVLFVETSVDPRSMERVTKETGLEIHGKLFTDSIAKEGEQGDSYYQMMKWNIETTHEGLSQTRGSWKTQGLA